MAKHMVKRLTRLIVFGISHTHQSLVTFYRNPFLNNLKNDWKDVPMAEALMKMLIYTHWHGAS